MSEILAEFAMDFDYCWLCGRKAPEVFPPRLAIHHIVRGVHRAAAREERCTFIRTCPECHADILDSMPIAGQLAIKLIHDREHYDRVKVNRLRGRADEAVSEEEVEEAVNRYPFFRPRELPLQTD